jgi:osmoprotectant transport system ATP-binding protein
MNEFSLPYVPVNKHDRFVGLITKGSIVRHLAEVYTPQDVEIAETEPELPNGDSVVEQSTQKSESEDE